MAIVNGSLKPKEIFLPSAPRQPFQSGNPLFHRGEGGEKRQQCPAGQGIDDEHVRRGWSRLLYRDHLTGVMELAQGAGQGQRATADPAPFSSAKYSRERQ